MSHANINCLLVQWGGGTKSQLTAIADLCGSLLPLPLLLFSGKGCLQLCSHPLPRVHVLLRFKSFTPVFLRAPMSLDTDALKMHSC